MNWKETYTLSKCAHSIDYFVSHDWQTGRWQKTLSLLLIFNSLPAAFAAVLVSFVTSGLLLLERLPGGWRTASLLTYAVYFCFLCFWQRMRRALCCSVPLVFVDRLCIAQGDPGLKNQGILGLAGFLNKSKRLLVLWSPNTFTRLWCTFELASFMRNTDRQKSIVLIPVPMASLLWIACGTNLLLAFALQAFFVFEERFTIASGPSGSPFFRGIVALFMLPAILVGLPLQNYLGIRHMTEFLNLKDQLHNFSVRASQCACRTLNHVDPQTGDPMMCDRELVFRTLKRWYTVQDGSEHHLDRFDEVVHTQLTGTVMNAVGTGAPSLRYVLAMLTVPGLGILPQCIHLGRVGIVVDMVNSKEEAFWQWILVAVHLPAVIFWLFWSGMLGWKIGTSLVKRLKIWIVVPLTFFAPSAARRILSRKFYVLEVQTWIEHQCCMLVDSSSVCLQLDISAFFHQGLQFAVKTFWSH